MTEARAVEKCAECAALRAWLDANTTYYDASYAAALAQFGKRIWLHATDDTSSYPFSAVVDTARKDTP